LFTSCVFRQKHIAERSSAASFEKDDQNYGILARLRCGERQHARSDNTSRVLPLLSTETNARAWAKRSKSEQSDGHGNEDGMDE